MLIESNFVVVGKVRRKKSGKKFKIELDKEGMDAYSVPHPLPEGAPKNRVQEREAGQRGGRGRGAREAGGEAGKKEKALKRL